MSDGMVGMKTQVLHHPDFHWARLSGMAKRSFMQCPCTVADDTFAVAQAHAGYLVVLLHSVRRGAQQLEYDTTYYA